MKAPLTIATTCMLLSMLYSCSNAQVKQDNTLLTPLEFYEKMKELHAATIIDVRTPEEYSKGHLQHGINSNWNSSDFERQISTLDPSKPVLVYCLSGGRSSSAAHKMRSMGFQKVYELDGGILSWRNAGLPETTDLVNQSNGMSKQQFEDLLISDKLILVDFYATWCAPCKKMKPDLDALSEEMKDKVIILRIDADENQSLAQELHIESLPTLLLYKNKNRIWSQVGYIGKDEISKQLMR